MSLPQDDTPTTGSVNGKHPGEISLLAVFTFVLWTFCTLVALAGYLSRQPVPGTPTSKPATVQATVMNVELASEPIPPDAPQLMPAGDGQPIGDDSPMVPVVMESAALPDVIPAVAMPAPMIAFAVPVDGPVRLATAASAGFHGVLKPVTSNSTPVVMTASVPASPKRATPTRLTAGRGLARGQPSPEWPEAARLAHQSGSVTISFTLDDAGNVTDTTVATPCRWPLLNQAALRKVADSWHFPPGFAAQYLITFDFNFSE